MGVDYLDPFHRKARSGVIGAIVVSRMEYISNDSTEETRRNLLGGETIGQNKAGILGFGHLLLGGIETVQEKGGSLNHGVQLSKLMSKNYPAF